MRNDAIDTWFTLGFRKFGFNVPPWSSESTSDSRFPGAKLINYILAPSPKELTSSKASAMRQAVLNGCVISSDTK